MEETQKSLAVRMFKSSSVYALSGILRNLVGFLLLPVYTRYLSPADYGVAELLIFTVSLIEITVGVRVANATQKYYHDQTTEGKKLEVVFTALATSFLFSATAATICIINADTISALLFDDVTLSGVVALFLVLVMTQAIEVIGLAYIRIQNKYKLFFIMSVFKLVVQLTLNITFIVVLEKGIYGLALASALSAAIFSAVMLLYILSETRIRFSIDMAKRLILFSIPLWISGLVSLYVGSSNRFFMNMYSSLEDVGLFSLAQRFSSIISFLIFSPLFSYWSAERFRLKDRPDFDDIHRKVFVGTYLLLTILGLAICLYGELVVTILADKEFLDSHNAIPFLVVGAIFYNLTLFYHFSFFHTEKNQKLSTIMYYAAAAVTIFNVTLIPRFGFIGASAAIMLAYVFIFFLTRYFSGLLYDMRFPIAKFLTTLFAAGVGYAGMRITTFDLEISIASFGITTAWLVVSTTLILALNFDRSLLIKVVYFARENRRNL